MHNIEQNDERQPPRGPRGGNSAMSIPPGADLEAGYATDEWPTDEPSATRPGDGRTESDEDE